MVSPRGGSIAKALLVFVHGFPRGADPSAIPCLAMQIVGLNAISKDFEPFFRLKNEFVFARLAITFTTTMAQPQVRIQVRIHANPCAAMGGFATPPREYIAFQWHFSVYPHPPLGYTKCAYKCAYVQTRAPTCLGRPRRPPGFNRLSISVGSRRFG